MLLWLLQLGALPQQLSSLTLHCRGRRISECSIVGAPSSLRSVTLVGYGDGLAMGALQNLASLPQLRQLALMRSIWASSHALQHAPTLQQQDRCLAMLSQLTQLTALRLSKADLENGGAPAVAMLSGLQRLAALCSATREPHDGRAGPTFPILRPQGPIYPGLPAGPLQTSLRYLALNNRLLAASRPLLEAARQLSALYILADAYDAAQGADWGWLWRWAVGHPALRVLAFCADSTAASDQVDAQLARCPLPPAALSRIAVRHLPLRAFHSEISALFGGPEWAGH